MSVVLCSCVCQNKNTKMIVLVKKDLYEFALDRSNHVFGLVFTCPQLLSPEKGLPKQVALNFGDGTKQILENQRLLCGNVRVTTHLSGITIFGLIVKKCFDGKASFDNLRKCLLNLKNECYHRRISHLVIPRLGCGPDRLRWSKAEKLFLNIMKTADMKITICLG